MTVEESKIMWGIEKASTERNILSGNMAKLYSTVDKYISKGLLLYDEFVSDMIKMATTIIEDCSKDRTDSGRLEQIDTLCSDLVKKYEDKYRDKKSPRRDNKVSVDNTEVSNG